MIGRLLDSDAKDIQLADRRKGQAASRRNRSLIFLVLQSIDAWDAELVT